MKILKSVIPIFLAVIVVGGIITTFVVGTFRFMDSKTAKTDLSKYGEEFNDPDYKFTGKSEHFSFKLGRAVFKEDKKSLLVTEIMQTKAIDYLKKETLIVKFNGKEYKKLNNTNKLNSLKNPLEILTFHETQQVCIDVNKECTKYDIEIPDKGTFKNDFEIGIEYCTSDGKCNYEKFKLNYGGLF